MKTELEDTDIPVEDMDVAEIVVVVVNIHIRDATIIEAWDTLIVHIGHLEEDMLLPPLIR